MVIGKTQVLEDCPHLEYSYGIQPLKSPSPLFHLADVNARTQLLS